MTLKGYVRRDEIVRGEVIVAGVQVDVTGEPVLPPEIGVLCLEEEASRHDGLVFFVLDLLIHYKSFRGSNSYSRCGNLG